MNKKILFVADQFAEEYPGGGELNNQELIALLSQRGFEVEKLKTELLTVDYLKKNIETPIILGNFLKLQHKDIYWELVSGKYRYAIYEHDHKYLITRDPSHYVDYLAPSNHVYNHELYKGAKAVFCQSKLHKEVVEKNLKFNNIVNLGGNLWTKEILDFLLSMSSKSKKNITSIWDSNNVIKNTNQAIAYCRVKNIPFELVGALPHKMFLERLSNNDTFLFLPKTLETLCRVVVECRIMNIKTITNGKLGATSEPWYNLKGKELYDVLINKRTEIPEKVLEVLS